MAFAKVYLVPLILGLWFPVTFITTYIVAVKTKHVRPILPYISDTGTWAPESCIFGMMLTLGGIMTVTIVYVRYRQVKDIIEKGDLGSVMKKWNLWAAYLGVVASFGCIIVADFQVTNVLSVHIIGAALCFGMATVYQVIQVILSFKLYPTLGNKYVNISRAFCACISIASLATTSSTGLVSVMQFTGDDLTKWKEEDGGYYFHVISAASEYILSLVVFIFFFSFTGEFKLIQFCEPRLISREGS